jgi:hypothetical protein
MTNRLMLLAMIVGTLAVPASATAGGWATVGLDSLPEGVAPGEPWTVELTILQHGRTPLEGVKPSVIVEKAGTPGPESFPARPTERPGVYRATVVFASAGEWRYRVDDGFSAVHDYAPVRIGDTSGASGEEATAGAAARGETAGDGPDYLLALAAAAVAGLAAALVAAAIQRRREGPAPASG